jgi:predicted dehydrogenase
MAKTKDNPVKLGIIGAGLAVKWLHLPPMRELPGKFKVVAVCDIVPEASEEITKLCHEFNGDNSLISQFSNFRDLLALSEVEAVLISLPIHLNAEVMYEAALAGKHILCEKPIASNLAQGKQIVATLNDIAKSRGLVIEIAENYHYREELFKAYDWAFKENLIGEVAIITAQVVYWIDVSQGFASTPWRMDNQYRGGIVSDGGVHYAAFMRRLGGEVEQIHAFAKQSHPKMTSVDTVTINLRFRNGTIANLIYSGAGNVTKRSKEEATLIGTDGVIEIGRNYATLFTRNEQGEITEKETFKPEKNGYYLEFLNFYEAIREGKPVVASLPECLRDFEIIMLALDSAEERRVILL